jgi:hypothetical protein
MSLLNNLIEYRDEVIAERDSAANPPAYMNSTDYYTYTGKELALDDVIIGLNKIIQEHS